MLYHNTSGRDLTLNEYLQGSYRDQKSPVMAYRPNATLSDWMINLAGRRYTSIVDANVIGTLERRVGAYQSALQIRYARDVRPNDLKNGNAILLGASEANPWVELYERNFNFVFHNDYKANVFSVLNRSPKPGEPKQWDSGGNDPQRRVYCLVAYVPTWPAKEMLSFLREHPCQAQRVLGTSSPMTLSCCPFLSASNGPTAPSLTLNCC